MSFLEKLLPSTGLICVATPRPAPYKGFVHHWVESLDAARVQIAQLDASQNGAVYLAQARFHKDKIETACVHNAALPKGSPKEMRLKERSQGNALVMRNFFFDIDCGADKAEKGEGYATQRDAADALKQFVADSGLPFPAVVNSGNGLYAHWLISEDIEAGTWQVLARLLKQVSVACKFLSDPMRTADSASVLRPPGTTNRKHGAERPVALIRDMAPIPLQQFTDALRAAAKTYSIGLDSLAPPAPQNDLNADFYTGTVSNATNSPELAADKCAQLRQLRDTKGNLSEPLWYAGLGVLVFCEEGDALCHAWSAGHPEYNRDDTADKIQHRLDGGMGATTCSYFAAINQKGCLGCAHSGKIKSPISLGRPEPKPLALAPEECPAPNGFRRADGGLWFEAEGGRWQQFYDQDLYPVRLAYDESLGYQITTLRHHLPHEGWAEFSVRSSLVNDPKGLMTTLWDNHVLVVGAKERKAMGAYLEGYMQQLQRRRRMTTLLCQMGWKERQGRTMFVLGEQIYHDDGTVEQASLARNVPAAAEAFHCKGDLATWTAATEVFNEEGMEPFAFALLAGGFGAPLMKFTGFEGAMLSLVGDSGVGKTLMLRMIQSVWGYHKDLILLRDDTRNMLVSRLGIHGNTPVTVDEVTNIDGMELSDLVYRITQGRDKGRLTKSSEEKKVLNHWNTLAVVSTNSSLVDKLAGAKHDASAEINRVFEYHIPRKVVLEGQVATRLYWTLNDHYGVAGDCYARWLVTHEGQIAAGINTVREKLEKLTGANGEERFWAAVAASAIYGGLVARSLGLIKFDINRVMVWAAGVIKDMRQERESLAGDSVSIVGQFLDDFTPNRIVVTEDKFSKRLSSVIDPPRGALYIRIELHTRKLYISRSAFKAWLGKKFGSYTKVKTDLRLNTALLCTDKRKILGAGTSFAGAPQPCWELDMTAPAMGMVNMRLMQDNEIATGMKEDRG